MQTLRSITEIGIGLLYVAGAVFNASYTWRHVEGFYGTFTKGAWMRSAGSFTSNVVIPHGKLFTVLLIVFQLCVAAGIITRGAAVGPALLAGGVFALVVAFFSSPGGTVGNLVLAAIQFALALSR